MAHLPGALVPKEVQAIGNVELRKQYNKLAESYNKVTNFEYLYCHKCNTFWTNKNFYLDKRFASGYYPICKDCVLDMATDYDARKKKRIDNKSKLIKMFESLDICYIDTMYKKSCAIVAAEKGDNPAGTVFQHMIAQLKSLPQFQKLKFKDSEFGEDTTIVEFDDDRKADMATKKRFGSGFTESDYLYLQDQYEDWCSRTQVDSKSQETYVMQICLQLLDIDKDRKDGKDVSNKLKALDTLMNAANLQPKQNVDNSSTDNLSFGQLIEKWENERPISEPSEEFKDVDGIGKYLRVWYAGWLSKALGLKNQFSEECEEEIAKYKVTKTELQEEGNSDDIYNAMFGGTDE